MTDTQPYTWEITANGVLIEGWKPFDLPSSSASSLSSLASTSSVCSCGHVEVETHYPPLAGVSPHPYLLAKDKEMKDKETQTETPLPTSLSR